MTELQSDVLMRYLHERGEMSLGERFGVEWQLMTDLASRREYADMERMHRSLANHFAPGGQVLPPPSQLPWIRLGVAGLTGAIALTGVLLLVQDGARTAQSMPTPTKAVVAGSYCLQCTVNRSRAGHCSHAVTNDAAKAVSPEKVSGAVLPAKSRPNDCHNQ